MAVDVSGFPTLQPAYVIKVKRIARLLHRSLNEIGVT